jgi:hypothetical protein
MESCAKTEWTLPEVVVGGGGHLDHISQQAMMVQKQHVI